ncbi:Type II secretion system F domain protein [Thermodesulfatator indicus DSM 15286]|uniref:Type II secretion system F domain protein n=1 Tax=Thermodesulfatator indicus (strain DSM 15286 / JCM 11887 / CIR29812) TaxID=667014 RepID=F8A8Y7_THEID|nr:type II secretion system F family protein [Thermodesulfatator indicus]AEH44034.1 Type II secretion system F domain protein [Thermodesulfatator indicus DSM 15286]
MPVYEWVGKNPAGEIVKGTLEAPDEKIVRIKLRRQKITPVKVKAKGSGFLARLSTPKKVKAKEIVVFTRQLAAMLEAGLPLIQALDSLAHQQKNPYFKEVVFKIKKAVEEGTPFSEALKQYPKIFDKFYFHMIEAGESSGNLELSLKRLATYMEKNLALKAKVKKAMIYPSIVLFVTVVVLSIIMLFVVPTFEKMFSEMGKALPLPTQIVIEASRLTKTYFPFFIGGTIISVFLLRQYYRTEKGRLHIDALLLKLPLFGNLFRKVAVARFSRTLSTLIMSGVSIIDALTIAAKTAGNVVVERTINQVRQAVQEGQSIADPLSKSSIFPYMVVQMVTVGEASGTLEKMLDKVAEFFEEEVDNTVDAMAQMIEPVMIVFLGVVIGGIIVSLYLPIFKLGEVVAG